MSEDTEINTSKDADIKERRNFTLLNERNNFFTDLRNAKGIINIEIKIAQLRLG